MLVVIITWIIGHPPLRESFRSVLVVGISSLSCGSLKEMLVVFDKLLVLRSLDQSVPTLNSDSISY